MTQHTPALTLAILIAFLLAPLSLVPGCPCSGDDDDATTDDDDDATTDDDDASDDDDTLGDDDQAGDDDAMGDDDASDDDDDDSASGTAPLISNFQIWIDIPDGEVEQMVNFSIDFEDPEGDIENGYFILSWVEDGGMGSAVSGPVEHPDATSGTAELGYLPIGEDWGFPSGSEIPFSAILVDRAENHSNELEEAFVFP